MKSSSVTPQMRSLSDEEINQVNGGVATIAAGAFIGGLIQRTGNAMRGGSFVGGFASGAASGALIGSGVGIFARSAVAGVSLIGAGSALGVSSNTPLRLQAN
ncbi:hypothetical protein [Microbulbifer pacificus]|uniref:hypothetical protein n=1 Tax=Microbulbifer pacificus TaxID=407164 RepID=UPI00131A3170|nr:hypothetical protein [Microbulbifer pacificus]